MDFENLSSLMRSGRYYRRSKGQVVQTFDEKTGVSFIKSGYVKRYLISSEGTLSVQSIYGPGYLFPLTAVFIGVFDEKIYQGSQTYHYEAMTEVEIYSIEQSVLAKACQEDPLVYRALLYQSGLRLRSNIQLIENISLKTAYNRVAHQLLYFANYFGKSDSKDIVILIDLTHQTLADILNLNRETVTRAMSKLREKNLITDEQNIVITDIENLKVAASL
jgi:CRP/FNR family transcriptional regulator